MSGGKTWFQNPAGERLAARLDLPAGGDYRAFALYAHCFTCTKDIKAAVNLSRCLSSQGIAVMRFDFPGLGDSEGDFSDTNFSSNVQDLLAAANWLREHHQGPRLLIGHSLGGAAAIKVAPQLPEVRAVATIGTPLHPGEVVRHFGAQRETIASEGEAEVNVMANTVTVKQQFVDDVARVDVLDELRNLGRALLVMHSPRDEVVNIEQAGLIFQQARHPKSFVSLDDADHLLSRREDADYAGRVIAAWAGRYLED